MKISFIAIHNILKKYNLNVFLIFISYITVQNLTRNSRTILSESFNKPSEPKGHRRMKLRSKAFLQSRSAKPVSQREDSSYICAFVDAPDAFPQNSAFTKY